MAKNEISRPATANIPPFGLRMQPELKEQIEKAAKAAGRSMNAEIVARLQQPPGLDASRDMLFLIRKHEQERAEAALDKHVLYLMLQELAFDNRALGNTLRHSKVASPEIVETISEWEKETEQLLAEAEEMLTESLEDAKDKAKAATDRLIATFERHRGYIAQRALERRLPSTGRALKVIDSDSLQAGLDQATRQVLGEVPGQRAAPMSNKDDSVTSPAKNESGLIKKGAFTHLSRGKNLAK